MEIPHFDFFINREKNKPCLIAGNAPSVVNFPFDKFKGVSILCNEGPRLLRKLVSPSYWVSANYDFPVPYLHAKEINRFQECTFLFADTATIPLGDFYNHDFLVKELKVPWFAFDDRHFNRKKCEPVRNCCCLVDLYPDRITLQEFFERNFGIENARQETGTVVVYCLMFAIMMGCSPIYLQGIELPLDSQEYTHYNPPLRQRIQDWHLTLKSQLKKIIRGESHSHFYYSLEPTLQHFQAMAALCKKLKIEIYNLSRTSSLNRIASLPYLEPGKIYG